MCYEQLRSILEASEFHVRTVRLCAINRENVVGLVVLAVASGFRDAPPRLLLCHAPSGLIETTIDGPGISPLAGFSFHVPFQSGDAP